MINRRDFGRCLAGSAGLLASVTSAQASLGLNALAQISGRKVGFAVGADVISSTPLHPLLSRHAGVLTPENGMKWRNIEGWFGGKAYGDADQAVDMAGQLRAVVRGHVLAWHVSTPLRWAHADPHDFVLAQTTQMQELMRRYAGRIDTWDVLNEAIEPDHLRRDGMRESLLSKLWGVQRYPMLFELAKQTDPRAKLAYNDYGMEQDEPWCERRRTVMLRTLDSWLQQRTPIDVVGLQAHLDVSRKFSPMRFSHFLDELFNRGLVVQITELDVRDSQLVGGIATRDAAVAALYRDFVEVCMGHPAVEMLVFWNLTDADSWTNRWWQRQRRPDGEPMRPTLFDLQGSPKPAFDAVARTLAGSTTCFKKKEN